MSEEQKIADHLQSELLKCGFTIQRYDAYSTSSIYLKLDYGVCNSIRISNHRGKSYLKYRYNIGKHISDRIHCVDKFDRYYFPAKEMDELVRKIVTDRDEKIKKFGIIRYGKFMSKNRLENQDNKGFWRKAYVVNK